jgi:RNA polymerase sigma factor (sigma-70 family)
MDTDTVLVARARQGDTVAFGQLIRRHWGSVHHATCAILGSATDADDVVQDAWLHAYLHLSQFHEAASFKTWVHAIVRNRAIDHHRRMRRRWRYASAQGAARLLYADMRSDVRTPEQLVLDAEREAGLASAMAMLPDRLRVLLELWHTGQYSYREMARIAGVRPSTIKSRIWQARRQVMKAFPLTHTDP